MDWQSQNLGGTKLLDNYKISDVDNKSIEEKNRFLNRRKLYIDFVNSQRTGFYRMLEFLNETLNILQKNKKIARSVEFRARIKAIKSALNNDESKILDDTFGVEIICDSEYELSVIRKEIEKIMISTKIKKHNKPNGYKAIHRSYSTSKDTTTRWFLDKEDVPVIECQYKTKAVDENEDACHYSYKKIDQEEISNKLKDKTLIIGEDIPEMWISKNGVIKRLTYEEIIKRVYPFVDISNIKKYNNKISLEK